MSTGQRIKELRKSIKLSQTDFAAKINLKQSAVGMVERGLRHPTDRMISDICRVYGCSENWLRTGEGSMYEEKTIDENIAAWAGKMLSCDDDFKKKFLLALSGLDEDDWITIEKFCRLVIEDEKPQ